MKKKNLLKDYLKPEMELIGTVEKSGICVTSTGGCSIQDLSVVDYGEI